MLDLCGTRIPNLVPGGDHIPPEAGYNSRSLLPCLVDVTLDAPFKPLDMAELQTVGAAFDLAKLAWEGCKFLRKVKNADAIVGEAYERTLRLKKVLENVRLVLEAREERGVASNSAVEIQTAANIDHCVHAAREILLDVENRVGGFGQQGSTASLGERVKVAFRHPGVCRLQTDLEARVSALSADLAILQL